MRGGHCHLFVGRRVEDIYYIVAMPRANRVVSSDVYIMSRGARHKGCYWNYYEQLKAISGVGRDASIAIAICKERYG